MPKSSKLSPGRRYLERLVRADTARKDWLDVAHGARERFDGVHTILATEPFSDQVAFNLFWAAEMAMIQALRPNRLDVHVLPRRPEMLDGARTLQAILNYHLAESGAAAEFLEMVYNARVAGVGIGKVMWGSPLAPSFEADEAGGLVSNVGAGENGRVKEAIERAFPSEHVGRPLPLLYCIQPEDYLQDPEATRLRDAHWAAHGFYLTRDQLEALQKAKFFRDVSIREFRRVMPSEKIRGDLVRKMTKGIAGLGARYGQMQEFAGDEVVRVFEIHDREVGKVVHLVPGTDEPLRETDWDLPVDGLPFVDLRFNASPWRFWTFPDMWHYLSAQDVLDKLVSLYANHVNRHAKAVIAVPQGTSPEAATRIAEAVSGEVIAVPAGQVPVPLNLGTIPADIPAMIGLASQIIHMVSGFSQTAAGQATSPAVTATEVAAMSQHFAGRVGGMRRDVSAALKRIVRLYAQFDQALFPGAEAVRVVGYEQAALGWVENVTPDQIRGEYDYEIAVGDESELMAQVKRKQWLDIWSLFAPAPEADRAAIMKRVFQEFGERGELFMRAAAPPGAAEAALPGGVASGRGRQGTAPEAEAVSRDFVRRSETTRADIPFGIAGREG